MRVPKNYESHVNQVMKDTAKKHQNVHLIDWHQASEGHSEYFAYDGIHLEQPGINALSNLITKELER